MANILRTSSYATVILTNDDKYDKNLMQIHFKKIGLRHFDHAIQIPFVKILIFYTVNTTVWVY